MSTELSRKLETARLASAIEASKVKIAAHPCMAPYRDPLASVPARRSAAIALLGAARRQKRLSLLNSYQVYA